MPEKRKTTDRESILICIPGTVFFMMLIFGSIGYLCYKTLITACTAILGGLFIWIFYW